MQTHASGAHPDKDHAAAKILGQKNYESGIIIDTVDRLLAFGIADALKSTAVLKTNVCYIAVTEVTDEELQQLQDEKKVQLRRVKATAFQPGHGQRFQGHSFKNRSD